MRDLEAEWPQTQSLVDRISLRQFLKDPDAMVAKWEAEKASG